MMEHVGLKLWRIDSGSGTAQTVRKRDRQREEDERWRETSVMSVGGSDVCAATFECVFMCVRVCEPPSLSSKGLPVSSSKAPLYLSQT